MSTAITVPEAFSGGLPAVFAGAGASEDLSGGITGGYGLIKYRGKVWSIQYQGNTMTLMRDDGDGPRGSIDVVIVKANAQLSKTFYINGWDENNNSPPDCASANGITPDQGVPHPQSTVCANCPKNAWGSAPGGGRGKACGDHRRMAVVPLADLRNESLGGPLLLRCPAASLQDMAAFDQRYRGLGYPYFAMAIKISFDATESFPKFAFQAIRPLTNDEGKVIMELRASPEVARVVNEGTAAAVAQVAAPSEPAFLEPPPKDAVKPQVQVQPAAVAQPAPTQPQPAVASPVVAGTAGGFGPVAGNPSQPAQPVAQAATGKPAVTMTGFGGAASAQPAQATQQAAQPVQPVVPQPAPSPNVVTAFEGSIDDRLNALLNT